MTPRDRNSWHNVACRELMRVQRRMQQLEHEPGIVPLIERRMLEAKLSAMRYIYGQSSTWDAIFGRHDFSPDSFNIDDSTNTVSYP